MIKNFLIIHSIGKDDKLGLRINKEFLFITIKKKKIVMNSWFQRFQPFLTFTM